MVPLFSSDLSAMMIESLLPGRNLKEENPRSLFSGCVKSGGHEIMREGAGRERGERGRVCVCVCVCV